MAKPVKLTKGTITKDTRASLKGTSGTGLSADAIMTMIDGEEYGARGRPGWPWPNWLKNQMLQLVWGATDRAAIIGGIRAKAQAPR